MDADGEGTCTVVRAGHESVAQGGERRKGKRWRKADVEAQMELWRTEGRVPGSLQVWRNMG